MQIILTEYKNKGLSLKNHLVMAPMTRCRAIHNIPNDLMAEYYAQRAGAALIISEGAAPEPNGLGYARIPGIFSDEQIVGWKKIGDAVHAGDSKMFVQLMHTGRIGHKANLPAGATVMGVSEVRANGQMFTDTDGMQDYPVPMPMTTADVKQVIKNYVRAGENAVRAGLDGVELHGANGYLIEQFLNPNTNTRTDQYGGDCKGRTSFVLELVALLVAAIGKEKIGIRFSPYSSFGDMGAYDTEEVHNTYTYLAGELEKTGIAYIHIGLSKDIPAKTLQAIRSAFSNTIIYCNGFTPETAESALASGSADLIAFGRSLLANPDLDIRIREEAALNEPAMETLYTDDATGYTDYLTLAEEMELNDSF